MKKNFCFNVITELIKQSVQIMFIHFQIFEDYFSYYTIEIYSPKSKYIINKVLFKAFKLD